MAKIINLDEVFKEPTEQELKEQLEKARDIADDKWQKIPGDISLSEYQEQCNEIYKDVHELSSKYRYIQTPVWEEAEDWEKEECLMTFEEFKSCCEDGSFINYDGSGEYGTPTHKSGITVHPSDITDFERYRTDFTHVYWYNR